MKCTKENALYELQCGRKVTLQGWDGGKFWLYMDSNGTIFNQDGKLMFRGAAEFQENATDCGWEVV